METSLPRTAWLPAVLLALAAACAGPEPARPPDATVPGDAPACTEAACACPAVRPLACGDHCVDPVSDPYHCGGCDQACGAGAWCSAGRCRCSAPQSFCPQAGCVDTHVDPAHCGGCGRACAGSDAGPVRCVDGTCVSPCPAGTHRCGAQCLDDGSPGSCGDSCAPCPAPPHARATCVTARCSVECATGYHRCGTQCLDDASPDSCGAACAPCPRPEHGTATCRAGACGLACDTGYHACGDRCARDDAPASCGGACTPCFAPPGGTATCVTGACDFVCDPGRARCGDSCDDHTSPLGCGPECVRCPGPGHGTATCTEGSCGFTCMTGFHRCGADCADDTAPASCGGACTPCPTPGHGTATCHAGACGIACDAGYVVEDGACRSVPRLVAPVAGSTVSSRRPALRWDLPPDATEVTVEVCRDRACSLALARVDVTGSTWRPGSDLPAGVVFWRVRAGSARASATWAMAVGTRSALLDTATGALLDVNGDGLGDVAVGAPFGTEPGPKVYVHLGRPGGLRTAADVVLHAPDAGGQFGMTVVVAGDVDGDGFADLAVGAPRLETNRGRVYVYPGGPGGTATTPARVIPGPDGANGNFGASLSAAGDVDGDGYADLAVGAYGWASRRGRVYLYRGGAGGLSTTPAAVLDGPGGAEGRFGIALAGAGDHDGDGHADLVVGADGMAGFAGRAYLFRGTSTGYASTPAAVLANADGGQFGFSLAMAGDLDGDGRSDLVAGAPGHRGGAGQAYLFLASGAGLGSTPTVVLEAAGGLDGNFGMAVAGTGDTDGDGLADVLVGSPVLHGWAGGAYLYLGNEHGLSTRPAAALSGTSTMGSALGGSLGCGRDVDGDGFADMVVGAEREGGFAGRVYVYRGGASGPQPFPTALWGREAVERYGFQVAGRARPFPGAS